VVPEAAPRLSTRAPGFLISDQKSKVRYKYKLKTHNQTKTYKSTTTTTTKKVKLTIHISSTPPRIAAANFERNGFRTLYSTFVPSSFWISKMRIL
jgi:hypothetical protein